MEKAYSVEFIFVAVAENDFLGVGGWVGVLTMGATGWHEKDTNNGVIREGQPSKQSAFLWELPVLTAYTLSLPADL